MAINEVTMLADDLSLSLHNLSLWNISYRMETTTESKRQKIRLLSDTSAYLHTFISQEKREKKKNMLQIEVNFKPTHCLKV